MYRHLLVLSVAGSLQASCIPYATAFVLGGKFTLVRRDTVNDAIHEAFFIPTVVAVSVVSLVAVVCVLMILLTSSTPNRPSLVPQTHEIDHDHPPLPLPQNQPSPRARSSYLSRANTASNITSSDSFYYNRPPSPSNRVQRKPAPAFQPSPNRTPPGTANAPSGPSRAPFPPSATYVHQLRPGVPQHPNLAKYNPEPLIYEPKPAVGEVPPNREKVMAYQWTRPQAAPQPGLSIPVIPASSSSMTRVGSTSESGGSDHPQHQQQPRQAFASDQHRKPSEHTPSVQNPPSPPPTPPLAQTQPHQKTDQRQLHLATSAAAATREMGPNVVGSYGSSMDHRDAYGGIETDEEGVRKEFSSRQNHPSSASHMPRSPPGYAESGLHPREYPPEKVVPRGNQ